MGKHLQFDLTEIERLLHNQAAAVEDMVHTAHHGLQQRCLGTAADVLAKEAQLNRSEVAIEEQCLTALALHQPVAIDLRRIAAALKINADLERIGDLALNLAERTEALVEFPHVQAPDRLQRMVTIAIEMLRDAHAAFVAIDAALADTVCQRDDEVDDLNREIIRGIIERMNADPQNVPAYLHVFSASRIVERIADHATNIAEDVLYIADGRIARRHGAEQRSA